MERQFRISFHVNNLRTRVASVSCQWRSNNLRFANMAIALSGFLQVHVFVRVFLLASLTEFLFNQSFQMLLQDTVKTIVADMLQWPHRIVVPTGGVNVDTSDHSKWWVKWRKLRRFELFMV
ncbi:hypothetical protein L1987_37214 [Smallanthus sonchifolius]|uniref:Uncharacterized protein n=1 Tax=Smallanthus sonchifolius TaxID=185202 RepID=A0ACB9HG68_9ASTR|nr:hypothetical protein L1987_37214 [Smallanthus sonchifolius]